MLTVSSTLDLIMENPGKTNGELKQIVQGKGMNSTDFVQVSKDLKLFEMSDRNATFWTLQALAEQGIFDNPGMGLREVAEVVSKRWNEKHEPRLSDDHVSAFLMQLPYKYPNYQKSFLAVCDGDLDSFHAYQKDPKQLIELLLRFLMCRYGKKFDLNLANKVTKLVFGKEMEKETLDAIKRMDFYHRKDGKVFVSKMGAYRRIMGSLPVAFADGLKTILLGYLDGQTDPQLEIFREQLAGASQEDAEDGSGADEDLWDMDAFITEKVHTVPKPISEGQLQSGLRVPEYSQSLPIVPDLLVDEIKMFEQPQPDKAMEPLSPVRLIDAILDGALQLKQVFEKQPLSESGNQSYVKMLEEENERLKAALTQEVAKTAEAEKRAMTKILQTIAGENSNYLLSDLYEESQGKLPENRAISQGRLINLFSALSRLGVEKEADSHENGDTFLIKKEELIRKYMTDGPIDNEGDIVKVRLVKYGWTLNGESMVSPLAAIVREEQK